MPWKNIFKKNSPKSPDPLKDLTLANLKKGYFVDWDMVTWEVTAYNYYDWGSGDITREWQLKSADDTIYLKQETDDDEFWSISRKINFSQLGAGIKEHIRDHEDPPDEITFNGKTYYLEESGGGHFYKDGTGTGHEVIKWDYEDDGGESYLSIEQWSETSFEASAGQPVEEYQFTNILPREPQSSEL